LIWLHADVYYQRFFALENISHFYGVNMAIWLQKYKGVNQPWMGKLQKNDIF